jgi:hypothetical protein
MAKLPALVSALEAVDGRERATIEHVARVVREAGFIPTTKRGSGAAEMTAREAVNLFLGLNGADAPRDALLAIERFRSLRLQYADPEHPEHEPFRAIAAAETFGEAMEALLEGMPQFVAAAVAFVEHGYSDRNEEERALLKELALKQSTTAPIVLTVTLQWYAAEIVCKTWVGTDVHNARWRTEFLAKYVVETDRFMQGFYGRGALDRRVSVEVTGRTFLTLWRALHGENARDEISLQRSRDPAVSPGEDADGQVA